jgi:REP element-mobilizing transposase RayT
MASMKNRRQLRLRFRKRPRRGRPPGKGRLPVAHRERAKFVRCRVLHVRLRVREDVPRLRRQRLAAAIRAALVGGCRKDGFRICEFSVQSNHIHLVCEADNHEALARGMQGFGVRAAKAINKALGRKGSVFAERYAVTVVSSARQVRNTLCYVLHNARRHGARVTGADVFSSARYFTGWSQATGLPAPDPEQGVPVAPARSDLLRSRWRYLGLIDPDEMPAAGRMLGEDEGRAGQG